MRWLPIAVALFACAPARAMDFGALLPWERLGDAPRGAWVEYAVTAGGEPAGSWLRFAALEEEAGGRWIEIWISSRPGSASQAFRLKVRPDGGVEEAWMRLLGGEAKPIDAGLLAGGGAAAAGEVAAEAGPEAAVMTAAGSFRARAARIRRGGQAVGEAWLSERVPLFGLVRLRLESGLGLELHASGTGARSVFPPPR